LKEENEATAEVVGKQFLGEKEFKPSPVFSMKTCTPDADSCQEISSENSGFWPTLV
tara:strand:- start:262 stop:429 length:168 start_codon:yes stop_codon:yes gene_type:complete